MEATTESQDELNARYANVLLPLTITFGVFTVAGVLGNALVLIVFALGREYRNNNFKIFVICLGIIDFTTSAFLIPAEMIKHRNYFSFGNVAVCKLKCFLNVWAGCAAALSLLVICIDRFRKVCQPFKKQITPGLALKLCVLFSFIIPVILSSPGAVMCGIMQANKTNIHGNSTEVYLCITEQKYKFSIWRYIYKYTFVILLVGVSISCIVMYILIGRQIYRHWGSVPASFRNDSGKERNTELSSDTFGNIKSPVERTTSSTSDGLNTVNPQQAVILKELVDESEKPSDRGKRPPLVKQSSSLDIDPKFKKRLIKQTSSSSLKSGKKTRKGSASSRRRTMSRQNSGFGMRSFPYKTLIWFILTIIFIVTYILYLILAIKVPQLVYMKPRQFATFLSFYRLYFINNIVNAFIYALLDKRFRSACRNIIPTIKHRILG